MNSATAKGLVITGTAGAGIFASLADIAQGNPPDIRVALGGILAASVLYALTDSAPSLAGMLAMLILVSAIILNGQAVFQIINKATGK